MAICLSTLTWRLKKLSLLNAYDLIKFIDTGEACFLTRRFELYEKTKGSLGLLPARAMKPEVPVWCWEVKWNTVKEKWSHSLNCTGKDYVLESTLLSQIAGKYKKEKMTISVYNHHIDNTI